MHGVLVMRSGAQASQQLTLLDPEEAFNEYGIPKHNIRFTSTAVINDAGDLANTQKRIEEYVRKALAFSNLDFKVHLHDGQISVSDTVLIKVDQNVDDYGVKEIMISWAHQDEHLGDMLLNLIRNFGNWPL